MLFGKAEERLVVIPNILMRDWVNFNMTQIIQKWRVLNLICAVVSNPSLLLLSLKEEKCPFLGDRLLYKHEILPPAGSYEFDIVLKKLI